MDASLRVFVVDDDQIILDVLAVTLDGVCELETFATAEDCLSRLTEAKPDLFLLDVSMPDMDGYTAVPPAEGRLGYSGYSRAVHFRQ